MRQTDQDFSDAFLEPTGRSGDRPAQWRVLVVDDEPHIGTIIAHKFSEANAAVTAVETAEEAMRLARTQPFDLIIADQNLPGASGVELGQMLLANAATARIPVLLLSGVVLNLTERHLMATNIRVIVNKPFSPADLLSKSVELVKASWTEGDSDPDSGLATAA